MLIDHEAIRPRIKRRYRLIGAIGHYYAVNDGRILIIYDNQQR